MKEKVISIYKDERGFALAISMLIMVLLTIIGLAANSTSTVDIMIAANAKESGLAFYASDGGNEIAQDWLDNLVSAPADTVANGSIGVGTYNYSIFRYDSQPCVGCSEGFQEFFYRVQSTGATPSGSEKVIEVMVSKILREGYGN